MDHKVMMDHVVDKLDLVGLKGHLVTLAQGLKDKKVIVVNEDFEVPVDLLGFEVLLVLMENLDQQDVKEMKVLLHVVKYSVIIICCR